ncbi:hypothetical protein [Simiduia aestuariiviva]|uniref:Colicin import membrane protein n=1 Tax=Simiduia aestuariiviva TaxID=1510459 RepID=A0A839UNT3_9GAMM|nr:hypothetical protein [Simiduia aestuariiviva]MBB3169403.1 colicin import membrane protein [Simiduia aestuariiviva]
MIVFSATHQPSGRVFVGSCRVELDFHWAMLVTQADENVPGTLFDCLRADGGQAFDVTEYAQAESARELAQLCREAVEEFGGELIKAARHEKKAAVDTRALETELTRDASVDPDADDDVDGWLEDRREAKTRAASNPIKAPSVTVAVAKPVLRNASSTAEAADMKALMASIEARRLSQRKSKPTKAPTKSASPALARTAKSAAGGKPESAAARERRIKAALAEQKAARLAAKEASVAAQADEMSAILARLDERGKDAERYRRRR